MSWIARVEGTVVVTVQAAGCAFPTTSAADMQTRTNNITGVGYSDGFRTGRLPDGRLMTTTGDNVPPGNVYPLQDNSLIIWDKSGQRRYGMPGDTQGDMFPRWPDGSEFWPYQWVHVGGTKVIVLGSRQLVPSGAPWVTLGSYGAVVNVPSCGVPTFLRYFDTPSSGLDDTAVMWYAAIAKDSTWVYIHGALARPDAYNSRDGGYVARVSVANVETWANWQFWDGAAWQTGTAAAAVTTCETWTVGGTEANYTLHKRPNGQWAMTTKRNGTLADVLGRYNAPNPWGPWTWEPLIPGVDWTCYLTGAAPGVPTTSGKLLVEWSRNGLPVVWAEVPQ